MRVAIVTVTDSTFDERRTDTSGAAIREWCVGRGDTISSHDVVADDTSVIVPLLSRLCDSGDVDLVLTTGGTGLAPRDVTPEATRAIIERDAPGLAEYIRAASHERVPRAALSRGVAGVRARALVINLPGSTGGVKDGLGAISPIIDHAVGVLSGSIMRHDAGADAGAPIP